MKTVGILRRNAVNDLHTFLVKLDSACVPEQDDRKVFSVIDRDFNILGTATVKESKHGQLVFEVVIPHKANASVLHGLTDKSSQQLSTIWGRANHRCQGIFCIELDIMSQVPNPSDFGYLYYHPDNRRAA